MGINRSHIPIWSHWPPWRKKSRKLQSNYLTHQQGTHPRQCQKGKKNGTRESRSTIEYHRPLGKSDLGDIAGIHIAGSQYIEYAPTYTVKHPFFGSSIADSLSLEIPQ